METGWEGEALHDIVMAGMEMEMEMEMIGVWLGGGGGKEQGDYVWSCVERRGGGFRGYVCRVGEGRSGRRVVGLFGEGCVGAGSEEWENGRMGWM